MLKTREARKVLKENVFSSIFSMQDPFFFVPEGNCDCILWLYWALAPPPNADGDNLPRGEWQEFNGCKQVVSHSFAYQLLLTCQLSGWLPCPLRNSRRSRNLPPSRLGQIPSFVFLNQTNVKFPSGLHHDKDGPSVSVLRLTQILQSIDLITSAALKIDVGRSLGNMLKCS